MKTTRLNNLDDVVTNAQSTRSAVIQPADQPIVSGAPAHTVVGAAARVFRFAVTAFTTVIRYSWYGLMVATTYWLSFSATAMMIGIPDHGFREIVAGGITAFAAYILGPWRVGPWSSTSIGLVIFRFFTGRRHAIERRSGRPFRGGTWKSYRRTNFQTTLFPEDDDNRIP